MTTTSTSDTTTWTARRVGDRRLAAGGACSTIAFISPLLPIPAYGRRPGRLVAPQAQLQPPAGALAERLTSHPVNGDAEPRNCGMTLPVRRSRRVSRRTAGRSTANLARRALRDWRLIVLPGDPAGAGRPSAVPVPAGASDGK